MVAPLTYEKILCKVSLQDQLDMPVVLIAKPFGYRSLDGRRCSFDAAQNLLEAIA